MGEGERGESFGPGGGGGPWDTFGATDWSVVSARPARGGGVGGGVRWWETGSGWIPKGREGGDCEGRGELDGKIGEEGKRDGEREEVTSQGRENGNFERDKGIRRSCKAQEGVSLSG